MNEVTERKDVLVEELVTILEASVRSRHTFLSDAEILHIK